MCTSALNAVLRIRYRFSFIYLLIRRASNVFEAKNASRTKVELRNNHERLENSF